MDKGFYRVYFKGLSFSECLRFGGLKLFPFTLFLKLTRKKGEYRWLPPEDTYSECKSKDLTQEALENIDIVSLKEFGYNRMLFFRQNSKFDKNLLDSGICFALNDDGFRSLHVEYLYKIAEGIKRKATFITGFLAKRDDHFIKVCNYNLFFDDNGRSKKIILKDAPISKIDSFLSRYLLKNPYQVKRFNSVHKFKESKFLLENECSQYAIKRGLFIKTSEEEAYLKDNKQSGT